MSSFKEELEVLINRYSKESESDTPDFILAEYLINCLNAFNNATSSRTRWYGVEPISRSINFYEDE